jgi:hypothetical protein
VGRIFDGVGEEIGHDLTEPLSVTNDRALDGANDLDVVFGRCRLDRLNHVVDDRAQIDWLASHFELARLDLGDVEEVADEDGESLDLTVHLVQMGAGPFVTP